MSDRIRWGDVLDVARSIVEEYDTPVGLRQLHYRLVAAGVYPNTQYCYKRLSELTAEARRDGTFPDLADSTRRIEAYQSFAGPDAAREWLVEVYRRDRTEGQAWTICLGVEKRALVAQLLDWFGDPFGIPVLPLGGWSSQSFCDVVARDVERRSRPPDEDEDSDEDEQDGSDEDEEKGAEEDEEKEPRPAVLIYAGDFDPSGVYIGEDFVRRTGCFDKVVRVGVNHDQLLDLPFNPYPEEKKDANLARFRERYGDLLWAMGLPREVQYEVEALPPERLRELFQAAIDDFWDVSHYNASFAQEEADREELRPRGGDEGDEETS